jgi:hypothetical protein
MTEAAILKIAPAAARHTAYIFPFEDVYSSIRFPIYGK